MVKRVQRIISGMLAALMVVLMMPSAVLTAGALQSCVDRFLKTYTLTGDGALDMVAIAMAQEGRTGAELGYTEQWCANFVSDCAILAGQTAAIPANSLASTLYTKVLNAGGTITTSNPQPGDLCFINWNGGSNATHVEIVYKVSGSSLYTIGGNSGSSGNLYTRYVKKHAPLGSSYVLAVVRPAYISEVDQYLNQCTYYSSYVSVTAKNTAVLWSIPCVDTVSADAVRVGQTVAGDTFTATAMYLNTAGEYWYQVSYNGTECYLYGGDTTAVTPLYSDLAISNVTSPSSIMAGKSFSIAGTITTQHNLITDVEARVYTDKSLYLKGTAVGVNAKSFSLRSSTVDKGMKFGSLPVGTYYFDVRATVENHHTQDGTTRIDSTNTQTLHETTFKVVDGTNPVISGVTVSDLSSAGYTLTATVTDDVALEQVVFSTWSVNGGGDDLEGTTVAADGSSYTYRVWTADHNNENGTYITDITAYDAAGNSAAYSVEVDVPYVGDGTCGDNLVWTLDGSGTLTISGTGKMENYEYKTAMPWYDDLNEITAVVIEEGVTSIGDYAFYGMPNLETIEIADTVTTIGSYAFKNCTALDGVVLPSGLTNLGESSFYGCTSLTAIDIPASLWSVQPYTFKNCTALTEVTFHEGNLMKIWDAAFYNTGLTGVVLPDCLDIVDAYVFKNCSDLAYAILSDSMTEIREATFYGTAIPAIEIPAGITEIGPYAFKNCTELDTVFMTENMETIGESAFFGCTGMSWLEIPEGVTTIESYAFKKCSDLSELTLPSTLTTLGDSALYSCTSLTALTIPANVETIGEYCFSSSGLREITFEGDAPVFGTRAFNRVTATANYPGSNATWTAAVMQNYGGAITWNAK